MRDVTALCVQPRRGWLDDRWAARYRQSVPSDIPTVVVDSPFDPPVKTEWCLVAPHSAQWTDGAADELLMYAWDNPDVVYPRVAYRDGPAFTAAHVAEEYSPGRAQFEDWMPRAFLIRTSLLSGHTGYWDMWKQLDRDGRRFKACLTSTVVDDADPEKVAVDPNAGLDIKATYYAQASPANAYLRCVLPARVTGGIVSPSLVYEQDDDDYWFPTHRGDAAVLQFAGDKTWAGCALGMQHKGIRVLVETDDNYTVTAGKIQERAGWATRIGEGRHSLDGHMWIVENASDGVIVTSDHLYRTYQKFGKPVFLCPNQVDPADWPSPPPRDDGVFVIGWFASLSHYDDARLVHRAMEWASRQKNVVVKTMGLNPTWWKFPRHHIPWVTDLAVYRRAMFDIDVGMAPVVPSPWSLGRSDVKALEYAMGGALPILSDESVYQWWRDKPALMARSAKDFFHHVKWCVANQDEAKAMAREARELVMKERTIHANAWRWQEALDQ